MSGPKIGLVTIGRNEGERLKRCLRSVPEGVPVVYVDSGSTDDSVAFAKSLNVEVETLDMSKPFTAARGRNAGWRRLLAEHPGLSYIQFIDGDCELSPGWIAAAERALDAEEGLCAVFGRRRERFPEASSYNALCDDEWIFPICLVSNCGGDALMRTAALRQVDGYSDDLIAGEEPDLCLRMGLKGWKVRCIDAEMTLHDADIHRASQNWRRIRRGGHAFAEHVDRHGANAFPAWRRQRDSIVIWGGIIPAVILFAALAAVLTGSLVISMVALAGVMIYPAQVARLALWKWRDGATPRFALLWGLWIVLGRFAQFGGLLNYYRQRRRGGPVQLIEYKGVPS